MARATRPVSFGGREVEVRKPEGWEILRFLKLIDEIRDQVGLSEEEMRALNAPGTDLVRWLMSVVGKVVSALVAEINLDSDEIQIGPLAKRVYREAGRVVGLTAEEFAKGTPDEQYDVLNSILELEAQTSLGKHVQGIAGGLMNILKSLTMPLQIPTGGAMLGGTTASLAPSGEPIAGPTSTS